MLIGGETTEIDSRFRDNHNDGNWRNQNGYGQRGGDVDDRGYRNAYPSAPYYGNYPQGGYGNRGYGVSGYSQGYQDGAITAASDAREGKPFNASPRGSYRNADHGYGGGNYGSYEQSYLQGYQQGYQSGYRRGRY